MGPEMNSKIQELQVLEQHLQGFLMEKQAVQVELNESSNALEALASAKGDVFRILGGIMLKSDPEILKKDLEGKKKLLDLRIQAIEKQEKLVAGKAQALKEEITAEMQKKKS